MENLAVRESQCAPGALGTFATRFVARGEQVATESPLALSLDYTQLDPLRYNSRFGWSIVEEIIKSRPQPSLGAFVQGLVEEKFARGLGLASHWEELDTLALKRLVVTYKEDTATLHTLYDIIVTNALTAELVSVCRPGLSPNGRVVFDLVPRRHGFYKVLSRVNHSCVPNATVYPPRDQSGPLRVIALRDIAADEEVTINYLNERSETSTSRRRLFTEFRFVCSCPRHRELCYRLECDKEGDKFCPCGKARYCSKACQVAHWKEAHGAQCSRRSVQQ